MVDNWLKVACKWWQRWDSLYLIRVTNSCSVVLVSLLTLRGDCIQERETLKIAFVLKSKRIQLHQTSSARDAKGTALRKGRKRERQRNTGRK